MFRHAQDPALSVRTRHTRLPPPPCNFLQDSNPYGHDDEQSKHLESKYLDTLRGRCRCSCSLLFVSFASCHVFPVNTGKRAMEACGRTALPEEEGDVKEGGGSAACGSREGGTVAKSLKVNILFSRFRAKASPPQLGHKELTRAQVESIGRCSAPDA